MRKLIALALLTLSPAAFAQQATPPTPGPSRTFDASDLFGLEVASDPQISPDGRRIAYVRRSGDIMTDRMRPTIWLIDTQTGEHTPLVAGPGAHLSPRWSPDGTRLAYISSAEGGASQLYVRWLASGESIRITGLPNAPSSIAWSPDGRQIGYAMLVPVEQPRLGRAPAKPEGAQWAEPLQQITSVTFRADGQGFLKPGYSHLFVVPAEGGAPRQVTFGDFHHDGPVEWSADGRTLYTSANRSPDWEREPVEAEIYAVDVANASLQALTDRDGPDFSPVVSPDGSRIAYLGFDDRGYGYDQSRLYVMDRDGSNRRLLTGSLDREVQAPQWAADGRSIYVSYDERGVRKVARVGLDGTIRTVAEGLSPAGLDRPYSGGEFSVARDGTLAITSGSALRPADIALVRGANARQLTRLNADLLEHKRLGEVRRIQTRSSHDQLPIDAWLTLPPGHTDGQRHPLILEIHGGPYQAYGPHFATDNQLFAAAGYAVLSVNPRGSTSYGQDFADQIHRAYPGNDYDDLMSAVDAAIAEGYADPERLFVTGGSGGGVLSSWIIGRTNRFRAAAVQKPVINMITIALVSDGPAYFARYWFGRMPWEDHEAYWRRSPLSLVGNVQTPALVIVGAEDNRTPPSEAEQYYTALQLRGVPTALIRVPGAPHNLVGRPSQSAARVSAILAWFERYRDGWTPPQRTAAAE
ncbi:MAG: prolyl oligopeptidase family serine peptidase [Allosphingosinicella sp.]|uniref:prolyl oligopeptidase family serine peptidase n=1 Tax=Allosphingosinicella sp. TaxID=2823234 RepID=UPI003940474A